MKNSDILSALAVAFILIAFFFAVRPLDPDAFARQYEASDYGGGYVGR